MMNQLPPIRDIFNKPAVLNRPEFPRTRQIQASIRSLFQKLHHYGIDEVHQPAANEEVKKAFRDFLSECHFYGAAADFERLLEIKSGDNERRDDGTYAWQHELIPLLYLLRVINPGNSKGDINLRAFEKYGGLETFIRSHLHHDTVEDNGITFKRLETLMVEDTLAFLTSKNRSFDPHFEERQALAAVENIRLMTRKMAKMDADGNPILKADGGYEKISLFANVTAYTFNMLNAVTANPITYMLKLGDCFHNLNFIGSPKFTPEKKKQYCNERENMFGPRRGFTALAMKQWPDFAQAIKKFDDVMGVMLYVDFNYIEYVDLAYPDRHKEGDPIYPVGIDKYLDGALSLNMPPAFSVIHINMHRMHNEAKINPRTAAYLEQGIFPSLQGHEKHFPELFPKGKPPALPNGATYAPNHM